MLQRALLLSALCFLSACARRPAQATTATVYLEPGEGTLIVTPHAGGEQERCSGDCRVTYPRATRLDVELVWPRPAGDARATRAVSVSRDLTIRGTWNDRSELRGVGGVLMFVGGGLGAGLAGLGSLWLAQASANPDLGRRILGVLGSALIMGIGIVGGCASLVAGLVLVGLRDHPEIHVGPLHDLGLTMAPTEGGAMLTSVGRF